MTLAWIPLVIAVSVFAALGNTLLKVGATHNHGKETVSIKNLHLVFYEPLILAGIGAYGLSQILWITELRVVDLSLAYPLQVGINFTLITGIAWVFLKEPMSAGKVFGIMLIFLGIIAIATG